MAAAQPISQAHEVNFGRIFLRISICSLRGFLRNSMVRLLPSSSSSVQSAGLFSVGTFWTNPRFLRSLSKASCSRPGSASSKPLSFVTSSRVRVSRRSLNKLAW